MLGVAFMPTASLALRVRRALVLVIGYVVALAVASLAGGLVLVAVAWVAGFEVLAPLARRLGEAALIGTFISSVFFFKSIFVAWAPFALSLILAGRKMSPCLACIVSGFAAALVVSGRLWRWPVAIGDRIPDDAGIAIVSVPLWSSLVGSSPYALICGVVGGLVFWRICFNRRPS